MTKATATEEYKRRSRAMRTTMAKEYLRKLQELSKAEAKRFDDKDFELDWLIEHKFAFHEWLYERVASKKNGVITFKDGSQIEWK